MPVITTDQINILNLNQINNLKYYLSLLTEDQITLFNNRKYTLMNSYQENFSTISNISICTSNKCIPIEPLKMSICTSEQCIPIDPLNMSICVNNKCLNVPNAISGVTKSLPIIKETILKIPYDIYPLFNITEQM